MALCGVKHIAPHSYLGIGTLAHDMGLKRDQLLISVRLRSPDRSEVFDATTQGSRFPAPQGVAPYEDDGEKRDKGSRETAHGGRRRARIIGDVSLFVVHGFGLDVPGRLPLAMGMVGFVYVCEMRRLKALATLNRGFRSARINVSQAVR